MYARAKKEQKSNHQEWLLDFKKKLNEQYQKWCERFSDLPDKQNILYHLSQTSLSYLMLFKQDVNSTLSLNQQYVYSQGWLSDAYFDSLMLYNSGSANNKIRLMMIDIYLMSSKKLYIMYIACQKECKLMACSSSLVEDDKVKKPWFDRLSSSIDERPWQIQLQAFEFYIYQTLSDLITLSIRGKRWNLDVEVASFEDHYKAIRTQCQNERHHRELSYRYEQRKECFLKLQHSQDEAILFKEDSYDYAMQIITLQHVFPQKLSDYMDHYERNIMNLYYNRKKSLNEYNMKQRMPKYVYKLLSNMYIDICNNALQKLNDNFYKLSIQLKQKSFTSSPDSHASEPIEISEEKLFYLSTQCMIGELTTLKLEHERLILQTIERYAKTDAGVRVMQKLRDKPTETNTDEINLWYSTVVRDEIVNIKVTELKNKWKQYALYYHPDILNTKSKFIREIGSSAFITATNILNEVSEYMDAKPVLNLVDLLTLEFQNVTISSTYRMVSRIEANIRSLAFNPISYAQAIKIHDQVIFENNYDLKIKVLREKNIRIGYFQEQQIEKEEQNLYELNKKCERIDYEIKKLYSENISIQDPSPQPLVREKRICI